MLEDKKISEIVIENSSSTSVFIKYGIDFCCGGGLTLRKACEDKNLDPNQLEKEILETRQTEEETLKFPTMSACIDYILEKHHVFELELLNTLNQLLEKLIQVHSQNHLEVVEYQELLEALEHELSSHFPKEENILFPLIKAIEKNKPLPFSIEHVLQPVAVMEREHEELGKILWKTKERTSDFVPPEYACNTWKAFLGNLKILIQDIQKHVFLENEILFPMLKDFIQTKKI
ncbi:MAG: DUF542 domain-containing protein [Leptospiraceae bacterium]|nr:DUF542 domain-containing protein [Leptospiraceae bacterium]